MELTLLSDSGFHLGDCDSTTNPAADALRLSYTGSRMLPEIDPPGTSNERLFTLKLVNMGAVLNVVESDDRLPAKLLEIEPEACHWF